MSLVQKLKGDGKTFGEIVGSVLNLALHEGGKRADQYMFMCLRWNNMSGVKVEDEALRERRQKGG